MTIHATWNWKGIQKPLIASAMLGAMLVFAPLAHADGRDKCRQTIERDEARLHDAIAKHGEHSHEAEARRHDLNADRERCWEKVHAWWNGDDQRWHTDHDWEH
jgi:hypothetical protein